MKDKELIAIVAIVKYVKTVLDRYSYLGNHSGDTQNHKRTLDDTKHEINKVLEMLENQDGFLPVETNEQVIQYEYTVITADGVIKFNKSLNVKVNDGWLPDGELILMMSDSMTFKYTQRLKRIKQ